MKPWVDYDHWNMCGKKTKFPRRLAIKVAKRWGQRVYGCPHCGRFHLASK